MNPRHEHGQLAGHAPGKESNHEAMVEAPRPSQGASPGVSFDVSFHWPLSGEEKPRPISGLKTWEIRSVWWSDGQKKTLTLWQKWVFCFSPTAESFGVSAQIGSGWSRAALR